MPTRLAGIFAPARGPCPCVAQGPNAWHGGHSHESPAGLPQGGGRERAQGVAVVRRAMEEPLRQLAANAGQEPSVVVARVREGKGDFGFNAQSDEFEPLIKAGVIDPTKVVRMALQNAASVASLMITTEAAVAEKPKKKANAPAPAGEDYDDDY